MAGTGLGGNANAPADLEEEKASGRQHGEHRGQQRAHGRLGHGHQWQGGRERGVAGRCRRGSRGGHGNAGDRERCPRRHQSGRGEPRVWRDERWQGGYALRRRTRAKRAMRPLTRQ